MDPDIQFDFDLFIQSRGSSDPQAVSLFIQYYYRTILQLLSVLLIDIEQIQDVSRDVLALISMQLGEYQPGTNFKVWLFSRVIKHARIYSQSRNSRKNVLQMENSDIENVLSLLGWNYRLVIALCYGFRLNLAEISNILRIPPNIARNWLREARFEIQALRNPCLTNSWELFHNEFRQIYLNSIDGDVSQHQRNILDRHIGECNRCAEFIRDLRTLNDQLLLDIPNLMLLREKNHSLPEQMVIETQSKVRQQQALNRLKRSAKESGLYVIPVFVLLLSFWAIKNLSSQDPPVQPLPTHAPNEPVTLSNAPENQVIKLTYQHPGMSNEIVDGDLKPVISANGEWVVFSSSDDSLVEDDANQVSDIFLYEVDSRIIHRISDDVIDGQLIGPSYSPDISDDGRWIIFLASLADLDSGICKKDDPLAFSCKGLFLYDHMSGKTRLISVVQDIFRSEQHASAPVISGDGRWVAYWGISQEQQIEEEYNFYCSDPNGCMDIYIIDLVSNTRRSLRNGRPISVEREYLYSLDISIGIYKLMFWIAEEDRIFQDLRNYLPAKEGVYVIQLNGESNFIPVSANSNGILGNGRTKSARLSGNGEYVLFASYADNLVNDDTNKSPDLFIHDLQDDGMERIDLGGIGTEIQNYLASVGLVDEWIDNLAISSDGRWVVYFDTDTTMHKGDSRMCSSKWVGDFWCFQLYIYDRLSRTVRELVYNDELQFYFGSMKHTAIYPSVSTDGSQIVFVGNRVDCSFDRCSTIYIMDIRENSSVPLRDILEESDVSQESWGFSQNLEGNNGWVNSVAYSGDGSYLASGGADGVVRIWRVEDYSLITTLEGHSRAVTSVALSNSGTYLASGSLDGLVRIWWLPGKLPKELNCNFGEVLSLALSHDGRFLAVGTKDGVQLFRFSAQQLASCRYVHYWNASANALAFSPNGDWLAIGTLSDGKVLIYQVSTGNIMVEFEGKLGKVLSVSFSPDGNLLATSSDQKDVNLWKISEDNGRIEANYLSTLWHHDWVKALAFSPNGKILATGSFDNAIRLWDLENLTMLQKLWRTRQDQILSLAFAPDGETLAAGSVQGYVRLWRKGVVSRRPTAKTLYFARALSDTVGVRFPNVPRGIPILDKNLRGFSSIESVAQFLPIQVLIPKDLSNNFTAVGVYTLQDNESNSITLLSNYIFATNFQPAYLTLQQGLVSSLISGEKIGASAFVEKVVIGGKVGEYVRGDWSYEDNFYMSYGDQSVPRLRWDPENGSHWLRWIDGDVYYSLEFHTRFGERLIDPEERITKEFMLKLAESLVPLESKSDD